MNFVQQKPSTYEHSRKKMLVTFQIESQCICPETTKKKESLNDYNEFDKQE